MQLSIFARYLGLLMLLASLLPAQDQVIAVSPAHSPSSANRLVSPGVNAGDYLYVSGQGLAAQMAVCRLLPICKSGKLSTMSKLGWNLWG